MHRARLVRWPGRIAGNANYSEQFHWYAAARCVRIVAKARNDRFVRQQFGAVGRECVPGWIAVFNKGKTDTHTDTRKHSAQVYIIEKQ